MTTELLLYLTPFFLCLGSFLNVAGHRLIIGKSIVFPPSACPHCKHFIAWYDNVPLLSWMLLKGQCRSCRQPISLLYPFIELFTAVSLSLLAITVPLPYFFAYLIFFSALIVTIRSDLETMLISRMVTVYLIPLGLLFSWLKFLPITPVESMLGSIIGYLILYLTAASFKYFMKKEGMGQGDLDLLAFIGAFVGPIGCWLTLLIASLVGSVVGMGYLTLSKQGRLAKIPFGPFLALGAMIYVLWGQWIMQLFLYGHF